MPPLPVPHGRIRESDPRDSIAFKGREDVEKRRHHSLANETCDFDVVNRSCSLGYGSPALHPTSRLSAIDFTVDPLSTRMVHFMSWV